MNCVIGSSLFKVCSSSSVFTFGPFIFVCAFLFFLAVSLLFFHLSFLSDEIRTDWQRSCCLYQVKLDVQINNLWACPSTRPFIVKKIICLPKECKQVNSFCDQLLKAKTTLHKFSFVFYQIWPSHLPLKCSF